MKKLYVLGIALFLCSLTSQANIWRVNNATNSTANFSTIKSAVDSDSVIDGDTIMIEGSATVYTSATIDKRLVLIGPGYFLPENPRTGGASPAIIWNFLYLASGSEGSIIIGLTFGQNGVSEPQPIVAVNDVTIMRCYLPFGIGVDGDCSGLTVLNNYFWNLEGYDAFNLDYNTDPYVSSTVFKGNIVNSDFINENGTAEISFSIVENNLFLGSVDVTSSTYRNNIWLPQASETIKVVAGISEYNLSVDVDLGTANNNQVLAGNSDLYTGDGSTDGKWQIKADSDYKGAGKDGTDPGPFGGSNPYVLSGLPALPIIYEISTTGFGSTQDGLPLTIKVRAN